jgi:hypothetical protein
MHQDLKISFIEFLKKHDVIFLIKRGFGPKDSRTYVLRNQKNLLDP